MSVLESGMVVPSRVWAVYHYLLNVDGQRDTRTTIENRLSPIALRRKNKKGEKNVAMLDAVLDATVNMGLVVEEGGELRLNPALPEDARNRATASRRFSRTLCDLFFQSENTANHPLGMALAWHLTQDPFQMRNWNALQTDRTLRALLEGSPVSTEDEQTDADSDRKAGVNVERWAQLECWSTFFGFAWKQSAQKDELLIPDPTAFLRGRLPEIFRAYNETSLPLPVVLAELAKICPLFEGGAIRSDVEKTTGQRLPQTLSRSSALAFLRLQQEGSLELKLESGAEVWHLPEHDGTHAFSRVIWSERKDGAA